MSKYTPGPLSYNAESGEIRMDDAEGVNALVATICFENTEPEQANADGALFAAAPGLLSALESMFFDLGDFDTDDERLAEFRRLRRAARLVATKARRGIA